MVNDLDALIYHVNMIEVLKRDQCEQTFKEFLTLFVKHGHAVLTIPIPRGIKLDIHGQQKVYKQFMVAALTTRVVFFNWSLSGKLCI